MKNFKSYKQLFLLLMIYHTLKLVIYYPIKYRMYQLLEFSIVNVFMYPIFKNLSINFIFSNIINLNRFIGFFFLKKALISINIILNNNKRTWIKYYHNL